MISPDAMRFKSYVIGWTKIRPEMFDTVCNAAEPVDAGISLRFRPFAPYLTASLSESGVSVAVDWNNETWDLLFDSDLNAVQAGTDRWRCELCLNPKPEFTSIADLWIDHLFTPLTDWIERVLMPARALFLCERQGARWAALADGTVIPAYARFAAFKHIDSSDGW